MNGIANLPLIAVTMGDPCGIGPEIIVKAFHACEIANRSVPFVIGDPLAMKRAISVCGSSLKVIVIATPEEARFIPDDSIPLLALSHLTEADLTYGRPNIAAGDAAFTYVCHAARLCLNGQIAAMATAPISKEAINRAGHNYPGHTELLAELCGTDDFVMMLAGEILRVSLVTIHNALADVPRLLTSAQVLKTISITAEGLQRLTGKSKPKLAVLSLNPHCGEGAMFGHEEIEIITPAIENARTLGIDVEGPLSADTFFYFALKNAGVGISHVPSSSESAVEAPYDGVVAMYHDQGLIPLKMVHFDDAVNITLGLPIIRTSVDHGTAYNLCGTGTASEKSLLAAVRMAADMASASFPLALH